MAVLRFNPNANSIQLVADVEGTMVTRVTLVLDTGATRTTLDIDAMIDAGLDPTQAARTVQVTSASAVHQVPLLTINRLEIAGVSVSNLDVLCMNLPAGIQIDGVLGLNFLRHFNLFLNFRKGVLVLQEHTPRNLPHKLAQLNELVRAFW